MSSSLAGNLERYGSVQRVIVFVAGICFVDREAYCRALYPFQLVNVDVELAEWSIKLYVELNPTKLMVDVDNPSFEIVIDDRPESLGLVEKYRVTNLVRGDPPSSCRTWIATLQESVDVVDAVQAVVVQAEDDPQ